MKVKVLKLNQKHEETELNVPSEVLMPVNALEIISRVRNQALKQGTKSAKTRSEVQGRSAKPFKQKGTGNARQGSRKGPHMRGGGVAHGPEMDTRKLSLNKKFKSLVLKNILVEFLKSGNLSFLDFNGDSKGLRPLFAKSSKTLVLYSLENKEVIRFIRNLPTVETLLASNLSSMLLSNINSLVIDLSEKERIEKLLA